MTERLNLKVEEGIGKLMTQLAKGERRRGRWLSDLVRAMHEQESQALTSNLETIKLGLAGLAGQNKQLEGRVVRVEQQVAAHIAIFAGGGDVGKGT